MSEKAVKAPRFKAGSAPWEKQGETEKTQPRAFKAGEAPWEKKAPEPEGRPVQAAVDSFGQMATMGYLPQMQAAVEPAVTAIGNLLTGNDVQADDYLTSRDAAIKRSTALEEENPVASTLGKVGGAVASGVATAPLTAARGAGVLARLGSAAATSGAMGAAANPGDVKGEFSGVQLPERLQSGFFSAMFGGAGQAVPEAMSAAAPVIKRFANEKAVKAAGAIQKDLNKVDEGAVQRIGDQLLEEKIVTPLARPKDVAANLQEGINEYGDRVRSLLERSDEALSTRMLDDTMTPAQLAKAGEIRTGDIKDAVILDFLQGKKGVPDKKLGPALKEIEDWFSDQPDVMNIAELQDMKTGLNNFIKSSSYYKDTPGMAQEGLMSVRRGARKAIEDKVDAAANIIGGEKGVLQGMNRKWGNLLQADDWAADGVAREAGNNAISLTDMLAFGAGAGVGSQADGLEGAGIGGLATALLNKGRRTYGNSLAATGANTLAKTFRGVNPAGPMPLMNAARVWMAGAQGVPFTEGDVHRLNLSPTEKAQLINQIRNGLPVGP